MNSSKAILMISMHKASKTDVILIDMKYKTQFITDKSQVL